MNTAHWDIEAHPAAPSVDAVGASTAPFPAGLARRPGSSVQAGGAGQEDGERDDRLALDPEIKGYLPGVPRAT
jgi:hypothetical protein